jgi:hypothetical protein
MNPYDEFFTDHAKGGEKVLPKAFQGNPYRIAMTNNGASAVDKTIAILPGVHTAVTDVLNETGVAVDAIMVEGNTITAANANVVTNGTPATITTLKNYLAKGKKLLLTGMKITVSNAAQLDNPITFRKSRVFNKEQGITIFPSAYKNQDSNNTLQVDIDLTDKFGSDQQKMLELDAYTEIVQKLAAGYTQNIQLFLYQG